MLSITYWEGEGRAWLELGFSPLASFYGWVLYCLMLHEKNLNHGLVGTDCYVFNTIVRQLRFV